MSVFCKMLSVLETPASKMNPNSKYFVGKTRILILGSKSPRKKEIFLLLPLKATEHYTCFHNYIKARKFLIVMKHLCGIFENVFLVLFYSPARRFVVVKLYTRVLLNRGHVMWPK